MLNSMVLVACLFALAASASAQQASSAKSVSLTIYNGDFALVKENRTIELPAGKSTVFVSDVAARIEPPTVHFASLNNPDAVTILEQNYQYDLLDPQSVINKSVGRTVTVRNAETGATVTGELLNPVSWDLSGTATGPRSTAARPASPTSLVIKTDKGIVLNATGQIEISQSPEGLVSRPRLLWQVESSKAATHNAEVSYLTQGMDWEADYVAVVGANDDTLDLQGWVTITNESGASFRNASLQLVAGDVRRVEEEDERGMVMYDRVVPAAAPKPAFAEEQFFDYHLYTLQRPADVLDRETKQISLLEAAGAKVAKRYTYDGHRDAWWWRSAGWRPGENTDTSDYTKVNVTLELTNSKASGLGMPLPKGTIRVYKKDSKGNQQFVGEDAIDHTPADEDIELYVGDAFDLVGEHKRTKFTRIAQNVVEETFQVTVRNHSDKAAPVTIVEHVTGDWEVVTSSHKWTSPDARTLNFDVSVPAKGEVKVEYRVRTRW